MYRKRSITTTLPHDQIMVGLRSQIRVAFPFGRVDNRTFQLYKSIGNINRRDFFLFVFSGSVEKYRLYSTIKYSVYPSFLSGFFAMVLLLFLLISMGSLLMNGNDALFTIIAAIIGNLAFWGNLLWQMNSCISAFEAKFISR